MSIEDDVNEYDLSDREIDIIRVAYVEMLNILQDFPRPDAIEGISMTPTEYERYHDGFDACREAVTELIANLAYQKIVDRRQTSYEVHAN